jgi:Ser/Thr protein kinase RdoA (MazF antagonist)
VSQQLPPSAPVTRLLDSYDDGDWVALMCEWVDGALPAQPWGDDQLERVLAATADLADALTPSPVNPAVLAGPRLGGWRAIADDGDVAELESLSPWAASRLDTLVALEEQRATALGGATLQHGDLCPFNVLMSADRVYVLDWPHAWVGATFCDALTVLVSAAMSGLDPEPHVARHRLLRDLEPEHIAIFLAAHSGFLTRLATVAGPQADRNLVTMVIALGRASLGWLRNRL